MFQASDAVSDGVINHAFVVDDETTGQNDADVPGVVQESNGVAVFYATIYIIKSAD